MVCLASLTLLCKTGLRTELLNTRVVALSNDYLALIDRADPKIVRIVRSQPLIRKRCAHM